MRAGVGVAAVARIATGVVGVGAEGKRPCELQYVRVYVYLFLFVPVCTPGS